MADAASHAQNSAPAIATLFPGHAMVRTMRDYAIKRGHWKTIEGDKLGELVETFFGYAEQEGNTWVVEDWGAFERLSVEYVDKTTLRVDTTMDRTADTTDASRTIQAWNAFLEEATGYDAKGRRKRAQDDVKGK